MILRNIAAQWQAYAPWQTLTMVEQDLVISRALIELYQHPHLKKAVAFRGGTALNKLYIHPSARYSEDIDLVQLTPGPIGETLSAIREVLDSWLGEPKRKLTERSVKLIYRYASVENIPSKLKIEINTTEHFNVEPLTTINLKVDSEWYSGSAPILTYTLNELMATKLRALYQRSKSRDLFDLWYVLDKNLIECEKVVGIFEQYCRHNQALITRELFEKNLSLKERNPIFNADISALLPIEQQWSVEKALNIVKESLIAKLKGRPWKPGK